MNTKWHIGTSGWSFDDWKYRFYPRGHLSASKHLPYYSSQFTTTEVNATFYRIISDQVARGWLEKTPEHFIFSLKMHQYLSHSKRLKLDDAAHSRFDLFLKTLGQLQDKMGPVLVQLPPGLKQDIPRLKNWLESVPQYHYAFEFRHPSWLNMKTWQLLSDHQCAVVYSDSPQIEPAMEITTDFFYARFHGPAEFYKSKYTNDQLKELYRKIRNTPNFDSCKEAFIYFNNNYKAYAIENARVFINLVSGDS